MKVFELQKNICFTKKNRKVLFLRIVEIGKVLCYFIILNCENCADRQFQLRTVGYCFDRHKFHDYVLVSGRIGFNHCIFQVGKHVAYIPNILQQFPVLAL
jgi:hypothetical protein